MSSNWKEKVSPDLSSSTVHHQTNTNPHAPQNGHISNLYSRTCSATKNLFTLLMETLYLLIKNSLRYVNDTRVLYSQVPLEPWSSTRLSSMKKKTLILDLDETLIHSSPADALGRPLNRASDNRFVTQNFGDNQSGRQISQHASLSARIGHFLSQFMATVFRTFGGKKTAEIFTRQGAQDGHQSQFQSWQANKITMAKGAAGTTGEASAADKPKILSYYYALAQVPAKICAVTWATLNIACSYLYSSVSFATGSPASNSYSHAHRSFKKHTAPDFILPLIMHRERVNFLVRKRPHVDYFLQEASKWYDLVVYTASLELYGSAVCDMLEKDSKISFKGRYYRQDCIQEGIQNYTKDLRAVNTDLANTLIIDNSPNAYRYFPDNAIQIHSFVGEADDDHLLRLLPMLDCLRFCSDVRNILSRKNR